MMFGLFRKAPSRYSFRVDPAGAEVQASSDESLLQAALNQGLAFPHNCRAGGCGACKCRLVSGKVKELTDKSYLLSAGELQANYILACQSHPRSDVTVEVTLEPDSPDHAVVSTEATIVGLKPLTADILEVELQLATSMPFTAGQYVEVSRFDTHDTPQPVVRSYSFASAPGAESGSDLVRLFIKKVAGGHFTEWLFHAADVGEKLVLKGPYGNFHLRPGTQPIIAVSGGSGLAPVKAILEQALRDKKSGRDVVLYFGARTQHDLYGLQAIAEIQRHWIGRFEFIPVLSDEPADSDWTGRRGLIPGHLTNASNAAFSQSQAYLCGPPPMVDACVAALVQAGVDQNAVFFDKFLDTSHKISHEI